MRHPYLHTVQVLLLVVVMAACGTNDQDATAVDSPQRPTVYTVNYPLQYFAQRIGGDHIEVVFPDIDGDPAYWEPSPEEVAGFQQADLILLNGAGYAGWVDKVSLPSARFVTTTNGLEDRLIEIHDAVTHTHGPGGEHAHGALAFTTWLDMTLAIEQAKAIERAFSAAWPEHEGDFQRGMQGLETDLVSIDSQLQALASRLDSPVIVSHPVYQYFEQRYGLDARSVHWEPDVLPDEEALEDLKAILEKNPAKWMIWEGEPILESVELLRDLGLGSIVFDPCGNRPAEGDYLSVMRANVEQFEVMVESE